jgi:putative transposase
MESRPHREEIALFRYRVIAEIVAEQTGSGRQRLIAAIARKQHDIPTSNRTNIGKRTLQRWVKEYLAHGLQGLEPVERMDAGRERAITPEVLEVAVALRREKPAGSIRQLIETLELADKVPRGTLKRSTLAEALIRAGCTRQALARKPTTFRRFEAEHRNRCWQGDCQHTLALPHPELPSRNRKVYLLAWIDDYSRNVYGQFYFEEKGPRLEDCLKRAILRYGIPQQIYVDNGSIYASKHLERICAKLTIRLTHSRPYRPQGRGKIERLFRFVDQSFLPEAQALIHTGDLCTLDQLNELFWAWLDVAYLGRVHGATKQTPRDRFEQDTEPLRRIDPVALREAFLWEEERTVDKTGCFSLNRNTYEVDAGLSRQRVLLRFDPYDLSQIQVWHEGKRSPDALPVQLRRHRHKGVEQPESAPVPTPTGLNYLTLAKQQHAANKQATLGQMSYSHLLSPERGTNRVN